MCVTCGKPSVAGKTKCAHCTELRKHQKTRAAATRSAKWSAAGLCGQCGAERASGRRVCERCVVKLRAQYLKNKDNLEYRDRQYATYLWRRFNLDETTYRTLLMKQGRVCAICKTEPQPHHRNKRLAVDHDHLTGRVRGLLCISCNTMLGRFGDDPQIFASIVSYLLDAQWRHAVEIPVKGEIALRK